MEIDGFDDLIQRLKRDMSILGRSKRTFVSYSRNIATISLYYKCLPTSLKPDQVKDYLYMLQLQSNSYSLTYFKHMVYGLRFLLKMEGLSYDHLHLPPLKRNKVLPFILSKEQVWRMLNIASSLKHRILIGLLYGCGLRSMEVGKIRLVDLQFERMQLHVVQGKGQKDRYVPLSRHLIRGIKKYIELEKPTNYLFKAGFNSKVDNRDNAYYSPKGIHYVVKTIAKRAGILNNVHPHTLRHSFATHLLEDGLNIVSLKELLGHHSVLTTMEYLHVCQLEYRKAFCPVDTLFAQFAPQVK